MRTLLKNGKVVNVFTDEVLQADVLIEGDRITGVDSYDDTCADVVEDVSSKYICPGFIDGHIHIESTMLTPYNLSESIIKCGTTSIVADPHEIANVCGTDGIRYMLEASEGLPVTMYFMIPSCVPATVFDESGATVTPNDIESFYSEKRVLGLGEFMDFYALVNRDPLSMEKITGADKAGKIIDGHAPLLKGKELDRYISCRVRDDHECSNMEEAVEKIRKGQYVMVRQGTSARNLKGLIGLFESPYDKRAILVTDDKHPADIITNGHIDSIIRQAVKENRNVLTCIRMATIQEAQCFSLPYTGAVAPGYTADILVLDSLKDVKIKDVYKSGVKVVKNGEYIYKAKKYENSGLMQKITDTCHIKNMTDKDFLINKEGISKCRVIEVIPGELITKELICDIDFSVNNGIDIKRDILKLAVCERHKYTGHVGLGFIKGIGMKQGAIASTISHDSHNIIICGTNETDMSLAANHLKKTGGGLVCVSNGKIISDMPLQIAGLMCDLKAEEAALLNEKIRKTAGMFGVNEGIEPFMTLAFVSLPVIPLLKMSTSGLINVPEMKKVSLFV